MDRPPDPHDLFICYAHNDLHQIERDLSWLTTQGITIWHDPRISAGDVWRDEIAHCIERCCVLVYFVSNQSIASQHCQREIHFAVERDKPVVPIYLENVRLTAGLELTLNRHQAIFRYRLHRLEYQTVLLASLMRHISRQISAQPAVAASTDPRKDPAILPRQKHAIAVLPFVNLSDDRDHLYFAEGLAEDLINGLTRSRDLIVKARSSSFRFQHGERDVGAIGQLLNVTHVVSGSVRKSESRVRINVQLVETGDETVVWSGRYDRRLTDVFAVQDEVTNAILEALDAELRPRAYKGVDAPVEAYNAYLRGRYHQERMELPMAIDSFERAIAIEPRYADAHAALAGAHRAMAGPMIPHGSELSLVRVHLNYALSIDPYHPVALSHQAGIRFFADREYQAAIYEFDRLVRQFPSTPFGGYQAVLHTIGRFDLALGLTALTLRLNPLSPQVHQDQGMHLRELDRLDDALNSFHEAERLGVEIPHEHAEVEFRRRNQSGLSTHLNRTREIFGDAHIRFLLTNASLLYLQNSHREAKSLLSAVEGTPEYEHRNWIKALFALRANEPNLAVDYYSRALHVGEFQAFVFCQPSAALEQLFPDFFSSAERSRMLQSVELDAGSLKKLDVPPLPAWASS